MSFYYFFCKPSITNVTKSSESKKIPRSFVDSLFRHTEQILMNAYTECSTICHYQKTNMLCALYTI